MSLWVRISHNNQYLCCGIMAIKGYIEHNEVPSYYHVKVGPNMVKEWLEGDGRSNYPRTQEGCNNNFGTGLIQGGFRSEDEKDTKVFNELNKFFTLVFKSEPRKNDNSGYVFYTAIWDTRQPKEQQ